RLRRFLFSEYVGTAFRTNALAARGRLIQYPACRPENPAPAKFAWSAALVSWSVARTAALSCPRREGLRQSVPRRVSVALVPIDRVGQRPTLEIGAQIVTEQLDPAMLRNIRTSRNVRRDQDALVVPEPVVRLPLELAVIDIQRNAAQFSRSESGAQGFFID